MDEYVKESPPEFATPEGLRVLLLRLRDAGPDAWRRDPEAEKLLRFCSVRYLHLARRYRRAPEDAMTAAFEAFREPWPVKADNPWAYVTQVVKRTMSAQNRADGLLCSEQKARNLMRSDHRDVVRFGEREEFTWDIELERAAAGSPKRLGGVPVRVDAAVRKLVDMLVELGWPRDVVELGVEYICSRLAGAAGAQQAFESLRRDLVPLSLLSIDRRSWVALCRAVLLGSDSDRDGGVLRRLLVGEEVGALLADDGLVSRLIDARPTTPAPVSAVLPEAA